jgi:Holliday junction resolvasome RuvABC ATP-dependent DNA helicase subunit
VVRRVEIMRFHPGALAGALISPGIALNLSGAIANAENRKLSEPHHHLHGRFRPGGGIDTFARVVAQELSEQLNVSVGNCPGWLNSGSYRTQRAYEG